MDSSRTSSLFDNGLIWFGAGVSLAEILTGTYFAELGFSTGICAIIVGHIIGCVLLFLSGLIGAKTGLSAMQTAALSFGKRGAILFAFLNVVQLVGWTGIMIYDGALSANSLLDCGAWVWCLIIGALIVLWICVGIKSLQKINIVAMAALFLLTVVFCIIAFSGSAPGSFAYENPTLSFGAAVELAVAMPLSWLPLISDYTRTAKRPMAASAVSAIVYGLVSCWMYGIGMCMALFAGESDIAQIMIKTGLGAAGLLIIIFSTVTTTYLDAHSAGVSFTSIPEAFNKEFSAKPFAIAATVLGTIGAILFPMENITDFLYLIGSVFAPMIAIMIASYFVLREDLSSKHASLRNLIVWLFGFLLYRGLMTVDTPVGNTLPCMLIVMMVCILVGKLSKQVSSKE